MVSNSSKSISVEVQILSFFLVSIVKPTYVSTSNKGHLFVVGRICCCYSVHDFSFRAAWVGLEAIAMAGPSSSKGKIVK